MLPVCITGLAVIALGLALISLLFRFGCGRDPGPLGKLLSARPAMENDPLEPYREQISRGQLWYGAQDWEDVTITSKDGLKLHARWLPNPSTDRVRILCHGYRSSGLNDFGPAMEELYADASLLLIDQRSHGQSEGRYITYGAKESGDVCLWAKYIFGRTGSSRIYLHGISMGAATVLMAGETDMPSGVCGVVADCGFTCAKEEWRHCIAAMPVRGKWMVLGLMCLSARLFAGFDPAHKSTAGSAAWKVPVLFVHGTADTFVPCEMSEENFAACTAPKDILEVEGAEHGLSWLVDPGACRTKLAHLKRAAERA